MPNQPKSEFQQNWHLRGFRISEAIYKYVIPISKNLKAVFMKSALPIFCGKFFSHKARVISHFDSKSYVDYPFQL